MNIVIDKQLVTLEELRKAWSGPVEVSLGMDARRSVAEASEYIGEVVAGGAEIYGVNTGFGQLARVRVSDDELVKLQENLVRSHAAGVGDDLDDATVRLIMLMKVVALAEGFSGVRLELVDALCALINHNVYPRIPAKGSVGASGDLAPLAHMAGVLIGAGEARVNGELVGAEEALAHAGIEPITLGPKEGLALLNGALGAYLIRLGRSTRSLALEADCRHLMTDVPYGVLTGDTLFVTRCGRADLFGSNPEDLYHSLQKIKALPAETRVYPGHDYGPKPHSDIGVLISRSGNTSLMPRVAR